jgi:superfamily II DNA/RNA helicase
LKRNIFISGRESQEEILSYGDDVYNEELYEFLEIENAKYDLNDFNIDKLKEDITKDLLILEKLKNLVEPIIKDPSLDDKLNTLIELINKIKEQKILIFSEYEETVEYIYKVISQKIKNKQIEYSTSKSDLSDIIIRFAPKANTRSGQLKPYQKEIDILISTDILSEGQNLQDCNVVINYDIHWNPVHPENW